MTFLYIIPVVAANWEKKTTNFYLKYSDSGETRKTSIGINQNATTKKVRGCVCAIKPGTAYDCTVWTYAQKTVSKKMTPHKHYWQQSGDAANYGRDIK